MGRKRKAYQDKFKIDAVREALHSGADRTEVAIKYNIAQSTLSEWITMFLEGKILTDEQKALEEKIANAEAEKNCGTGKAAGDNAHGTWQEAA